MQEKQVKYCLDIYMSCLVQTAQTALYKSNLFNSSVSGLIYSFHAAVSHWKTQLLPWNLKQWPPASERQSNLLQRLTCVGVTVSPASDDKPPMAENTKVKLLLPLVNRNIMALLVTAAPSQLTSQMKGMKGKRATHALEMLECHSTDILSCGAQNLGHTQCRTLQSTGRNNHPHIYKHIEMWLNFQSSQDETRRSASWHPPHFLPEAAQQTLRSLKDTKTRHLIHKYFHQHVKQQVGEEQISSDWANWGRRTGQEAACVGCCTETELQISPKTAWLCKLILQFAQKGHRDGKKEQFVCVFV